ncbi:CGNR zinc finger domain-containing protein [Micromonosporaceae bacterium Da 78-11]
MEEHRAVLLALLNSTPVVDGVPTDELGDDGAADQWPPGRRLPAGRHERRILREGRDLLQAVVRGQRPPSDLTPLLAGVVSRPSIDDDAGLAWTIEAGPAHAVLVDAIVAWDELRRAKPGRLRPCANDECALFLLDRSKSNNARWCSMAVCGNKLKARRHYRRVRGDDA